MGDEEQKALSELTDEELIELGCEFADEGRHPVGLLMELNRREIDPGQVPGADEALQRFSEGVRPVVEAAFERSRIASDDLYRQLQTMSRPRAGLAEPVLPRAFTAPMEIPYQLEDLELPPNPVVAQLEAQAERDEQMTAVLRSIDDRLERANRWGWRERILRVFVPVVAAIAAVTAAVTGVWTLLGTL